MPPGLGVGLGLSQDRAAQVKAAQKNGTIDQFMQANPRLARRMGGVAGTATPQGQTAANILGGGGAPGGSSSGFTPRPPAAAPAPPPPGFGQANPGPQGMNRPGQGPGQAPGAGMRPPGGNQGGNDQGVTVPNNLNGAPGPGGGGAPIAQPGPPSAPLAGGSGAAPIVGAVGEALAKFLGPPQQANPTGGRYDAPPWMAANKGGGGSQGLNSGGRGMNFKQ